MSVYEKLMKVQSELKAPKNQYNSFGKYKYRSCEDILEGAKPVLAKYGAAITIRDDIEIHGDRTYIKATATFYDIDNGTCIENTAFAREEAEKKGMDASQITGTASSYARKYCLNGLLLIDDTRDADTDEAKNEQDARAKKQQRKNPDAAEPRNEKISDKEVQLLINLCARAGKDVAVVFPKGVENLTASQYAQACQTLQGLIQAKEGK